MIRINVRVPSIEIDIKGNVYNVDLADDKVLNWNKTWLDYSDNVHNVTSDKAMSDEEKIDKFTDILKTAYNALLVGEPFEEIFKICNYSTLIVSNVFGEILKSIYETNYFNNK